MPRIIEPIRQYFDDKGAPLSRGKLFFYESGTTNAKDTYADNEETIVNSNPVILDGEGRCSSVFGSGAYSVTLKDKNDVQIDQVDNVTGASGGGGSTGFDLWSAQITYNTGDIVTGDNDLYYRSLSDNNLNQSPATNSTDWEEIRFIGTYNLSVTYSTGDIVRTTDGNLWKSMIDSNINNDPSTDDGTNWQPAIKQDLIDTPSNVTPANLSDGIAATNPVLTGSAYSGGGEHISSQWQVASDAGFTSIIYDSGFVSDLTTHTTTLSLGNTTVYYWRVRYRNASNISEYSTITSFTTQKALSDLFTATTYTGNGTSLSVNTGIDGSTNNVNIFTLARSPAGSAFAYNKTLPANYALVLATTNQGFSDSAYLSSFDSTGFTLGSNTSVNSSGDTYVAYSWVEQEGFYDSVLFTGTGANQTIAHNLNNEVGCLVTKAYASGNEGWYVWFKGMALNDYLTLNLSVSAFNDANIFPTNPTSTQFELGSTTAKSGDTGIAHLFAHNPSRGVYCGVYTGTNAASNKIVTGFPVGFLLVKNITSSSTEWVWVDYQRGFTGSSANAGFHEFIAEATTGYDMTFDSDGFTINAVGQTELNSSGDEYAFMAIADPATF